MELKVKYKTKQETLNLLDPGIVQTHSYPPYSNQNRSHSEFQRLSRRKPKLSLRLDTKR